MIFKIITKELPILLSIFFCFRSLFKKLIQNFKACILIGQCRVTGSTIINRIDYFEDRNTYNQRLIMYIYNLSMLAVDVLQ